MSKSSQALRDILPLVFTSFVNKCGQIGLTLLPILILEKNIPVHEGSVILGTVKAAVFVGTYLGGWSSDTLGLRYTILISFLGCAIGLGGLPFVPTTLGLLVLGVIAQTAHAMFPSAARMMLKTLLPGERLQQGVGWLRAANNGGQIVSYGLGAIFASFGTLAFFYLDAITSLLACVLGFFLLPKHTKKVEEPGEDSIGVWQLLNPKNLRNPAISMFLHCSVLFGLFTLMYEIVMIGVASKAKIIFGNEGLRIFSEYMVINTVLCTIFSVPAATYFKDPKKTFLGGIFIIGLGGAVSLHAAPSRLDLYLGSLLVTLGEIVYASTAQYTLIKLVPKSKKTGSLYSISIIIQKIGIVVAGIVTLPLVVNGGHAAVAVGVITVATLALTVIFPWRKIT